MTPVIQYGFAGMCAVLLCIIVWLMKNLMKLLEKSNQVISANTAAICQVDSHTVESLKLLRQTYDKIIARPCIAKGEN
jgi:hypothetical protein